MPEKVGKWKSEAVAKLTGKRPTAELPPQLPHEVELTLAAADQIVPLFPYRIEYLRFAAEEGEGSGIGKGRTPLTVIEFFEVRQASDVDRGQFEFNPEDRDFDDVTPSYLRKLGLGQGKP